jgi:isoamylase
LSGSADLYGHSGRHPHASINFITCHDGFCLRDLVSYNGKHNLANGENNCDGESHNNSWNCGEEGGSADPAVNALRYRQARNFLATLFFSQGVPMLLAGDDRWHTQRGNNNCYCQDNALSWLEWNSSDTGAKLRDFIQQLIALRAEYPVLCRKNFLTGDPPGEGLPKDVLWWNTDGREMSQADWDSGFIRCFGMHLTGGVLNENDELGRPRKSGSVFLLFNAHHQDLSCIMPPTGAAKFWKLRLTTADAAGRGRVSGGQPFPVEARSLALFVTAPPVPPAAAGHRHSAVQDAAVKMETLPFGASKEWFSKMRSRISLGRRR